MISSFCPFPSIFLFRLLSFSTARCVAVHQRTASHRIASRSLPSLHFLLYSFATCIFLNSHFILGNKKSRAFPFFFLWRWCSCCCCVDGCPYAHGHKGSSSHRPIVASRSWISNYRLLLFIALHCKDGGMALHVMGLGLPRGLEEREMKKRTRVTLTQTQIHINISVGTKRGSRQKSLNFFYFLMISAEWLGPS